MCQKIFFWRATYVCTICFGTFFSCLRASQLGWEAESEDNVEEQMLPWCCLGVNWIMCRHWWQPAILSVQLNCQFVRVSRMGDFRQSVSQMFCSVSSYCQKLALWKWSLEHIPDWPANSPDFSSIENLWAVINGKLRNEDTSTVTLLVCTLWCLE